VTFDELERLIAAGAGGQGVLSVRTERGARTYALGPRTHLEGTQQMLDWRSAPLAGCSSGTHRRVLRARGGERTSEGTVVERWLIAGRARG